MFWLLPRLGVRIAMLLLVQFLVFLAIDALPGNAAASLLGTNQTPEAQAQLERTLGLDRPLLTRYMAWLGGVVHGDFGNSVQGRPISELLLAALPVTLTTTGIAFLLTGILSTITAICWVSLPPRSLTARIIDWLSTSVIAVPEFVIGVFLVAVFALWLGILPAVTIPSGGLPASTTMYVLPVVTLLIPQVAWNTRVLKAALTDALETRAVRSAVLNGIIGWRLLIRHVFPLAVPAFTASMATSAGILVAGTVTVEALFNHPGVGLLVASAVSGRDVSVLLAVLTVSGFIILILLTLADAAKLAFTPKVKI